MTNVFIMAVPWREDRAAYARSLEEATDGTIVWDQDHNAYLTYLRVLEAIGSDPAIVLEDDILLCRDWTTRIEEVIAQHPDDVINFYGTRRNDPGLHWMHYKSFGGGMCVYFPAGVAQGFREWLGTKRSAFRDQYHDQLLGWYIGGVMKSGFWLHVPSLVQHLTLVSAVDPSRPINRQSATFEML